MLSISDSLTGNKTLFFTFTFLVLFSLKLITNDNGGLFMDLINPCGVPGGKYSNAPRLTGMGLLFEV
jgi:hypothetical protein